MSQAVFSNTTRALSVIGELVAVATLLAGGCVPRRPRDAGLRAVSLAEFTAAVEALLAEIAQLLA